MFASVLPALVREFVRLDQAGVTFDMLFLNRRRVAEEYDRLAASQGFRNDIEGVVVVDLVVGALLLNFLATTAPPTDAYRERLLDVVLAGARRAPPN